MVRGVGHVDGGCKADYVLIKAMLRMFGEGVYVLHFTSNDELWLWLSLVFGRGR